MENQNLSAMNAMFRFVFQVLAIIIVIQLSGCTTLRPVEPGLSSAQVSHLIKPGALIEIITAAGYEKTVKVATVTETEIISAQGDRYTLDEIQVTAFRESTELTKNTGNVLGGALLIFFLYWAYSGEWLESLL